MPQELLYYNLEKALLQQALAKHAHRSDYREGLQVQKRPRTPPRRKPKAPKLPNLASTAPAAGSFFPGRASSHPTGSIELNLIAFSSGTIRCRISRCLDTTSYTSEAVENWLKARCTWMRSGSLSVEALGLSSPRARTALPPVKEASSPKEAPKEGAARRSGSPPRSRSPPPSLPATEGIAALPRGSKFTGKESDSPWTFTKHLANTGGKVVSPAVRTIFFSESGTLSQVLVNDFAALLFVKEKQQACPVKVSDLLLEVPEPTLMRWKRLIKSYRDDRPEEFSAGGKLARALVHRRLMFHVLEAEEGRGYDENATLQLTKQASDTWAAGGFSIRSVRWLSLLPVLNGFETATKLIARFWADIKFEVSIDRLVQVACAVERGESLKACGGMVLSGDHMRKCLSPDATVRPPRSGENITSDWLLDALSQAPDDEHLELGDSVRLLAHLAALAVDLSPPSVEDESPEARIQAIVDEPCFNQAAWALLRHSAPQRRVLSHDGAESPSVHPPPASPASVVEGPMDDFNTAFKVFTQHLQEVTQASAAPCGPLVLELLLQRETCLADGAVSTEVLVGQLLWERVGWDFPEGRRVLRRLVRVFDRYSSQAGMSTAGFVRLCTDAGLTAQPPDLNEIYKKLVPAGQAADFLEFLQILEEAVVQSAKPISLSASTLGGGGLLGVWACMERAIQRVTTITTEARRHRAAITAAKKTSAKFNRQTSVGSGKSSKSGSIPLALGMECCEEEKERHDVEESEKAEARRSSRSCRSSPLLEEGEDEEEEEGDLKEHHPLDEDGNPVIRPRRSSSGSPLEVTDLMPEPLVSPSDLKEALQQEATIHHAGGRGLSAPTPLSLLASEEEPARCASGLSQSPSASPKATLRAWNETA